MVVSSLTLNALVAEREYYVRTLQDSIGVGQDLGRRTLGRPTVDHGQWLRKFKGSPATGQAQLTNSPVEDSVMKAVSSQGRQTDICGDAVRHRHEGRLTICRAKRGNATIH